MLDDAGVRLVAGDVDVLWDLGVATIVLDDLCGNRSRHGDGRRDG